MQSSCRSAEEMPTITLTGRKIALGVGIDRVIDDVSAVDEVCPETVCCSSCAVACIAFWKPLECASLNECASLDECASLNDCATLDDRAWLNDRVWIILGVSLHNCACLEAPLDDCASNGDFASCNERPLHMGAAVSAS